MAYHIRRVQYILRFEDKIWGPEGGQKSGELLPGRPGQEGPFRGRGQDAVCLNSRS